MVASCALGAIGVDELLVQIAREKIGAGNRHDRCGYERTEAMPAKAIPTNQELKDERNSAGTA